MTVFGLDPNYKSTLDKKNKFKFVNNLLLYGILARENEFDVAAADEALYTLLKNNKSAEFNNVECVLTNTSIYKCIVFWWIDDLNRQHGLVVRQDDARAIAFAREKLKSRAQNLM